jgi:prevent-host-death family protein
MMQTATSQEFNRQASALRLRATAAPLLITDRGRPAHVLMSYAAYQALQGPVQSVADLLAMPVADELDEVLQASRDLARSADLS